MYIGWELYQLTIFQPQRLNKALKGRDDNQLSCQGEHTCAQLILKCTLCSSIIITLPHHARDADLPGDEVIWLAFRFPRGLKSKGVPCARHSKNYMR